MVQAIQVLRFHLLELEKVSEWVKFFAISRKLCIILLYGISWYSKSISGLLLSQRYLFEL